MPKGGASYGSKMKKPAKKKKMMKGKKGKK